MRIRIPPKRIRERFILIYELKGCQRAVDFLTKFYGIRRMKIVLDGRKVGNGDVACYFENRAYFTKRGLTKRTVLHEFYHHLVSANDQDIPNRIEEREANGYARKFLRE